MWHLHAFIDFPNSQQRYCSAGDVAACFFPSSRRRNSTAASQIAARFFLWLLLLQLCVSQQTRPSICPLQRQGHRRFVSCTMSALVSEAAWRKSTLLQSWLTNWSYFQPKIKLYPRWSLGRRDVHPGGPGCALLRPASFSAKP